MACPLSLPLRPLGITGLALERSFVPARLPFSQAPGPAAAPLGSPMAVLTLSAPTAGSSGSWPGTRCPGSPSSQGPPHTPHTLLHLPKDILRAAHWPVCFPEPSPTHVLLAPKTLCVSVN